VSGSKAFVVGFAIFLVVLVVGFLAVALLNISNQNNSLKETDSQLKTQSSPTLSAMAALASVVVFILGLKLFFKKSPARVHTNGF
jgi:H+/Cl- antiporter ClcA